MKKTFKKIKRHFQKREHHYKLALLGIVLFAIFFFAHTAGDGANQEKVGMKPETEKQAEGTLNASQDVAGKVEAPEQYKS